ncbi:LamG domain-containing protein [Actinoallomurus sp. NPDC052308]|uniref:LamG domain-containing protein n=1 Tax=Actinoallomurus sp. NPDC052308 TaxID=3155530 RepID=UPI0034182257
MVKTRDAAQDPQLAKLKFATATTGVALQEDTEGGLRAVDAGGGGTVFEAQQPLMWDSAKDPATANTAAKARSATGDPGDGPGGATHRAPVDIDVTRDAVTLTPDQKLLSDPATTFPVYIDPVYRNTTATHWLMVSSGGWKDYDFKNDEGMGYCPYSYTYDCGSPHVKRLFYRMPTSGFGGKTILSAEFQIKETFAPSCDGRSVELWKTKAFTTSSTWSSTKDNWLKELDSKDVAKGYPGCPSGDVIFDATSAMKEAAQGGWSTLTLGLRATHEDDQLGWKRFADDADLRVRYNTPPPQPKMSNLSMNPGGICTSSGRPTVNRPPVAKAILTDPDDEDANKVSAQFQASWDDGSGWGARWTSSLIGPKKSGTTFQVTLPSTIPQNKPIDWHVRAYDGTSYSPWSYAGNATGCYFVYDPTAPEAPTVSSTDYPESDPENADDPWIDGVGKYGTFTVASSSKDVTKYWYGLNAAPSAANEVKPAVTGGPVSINLMPTHAGMNRLYVQAWDAAGSNSVIADYEFKVKAGSNPKATWNLDEPIDSAQVMAGVRKEPDATTDPDPIPADVHGGATLGVDGVTKTAMQLNGTDAYAATSGPLIDTSKSFAVSAWARAVDGSHHATVATQLGDRKAGFYLQFRAASGSTPMHWTFGRAGSDSDSDPNWYAASSATAQLNQWTHLVGVYDAAAKTLSLYVNGRFAQTVACPTAWNAQGAFQIGQTLWAGNRLDYWPGDLDDIRVFDRVVTGDEAKDLFTQRPVVAARWKFNDSTSALRTAKAYWKLDEAAGATRAEDAQGAFPAGAHGGVTFGGTGKVGKALHLNGSTGYLATSGQVVDTTKSFSISAWTKLASKTGTPVIAGQEGSRNSAFVLYYSSFYDRWIFNMQTPDVDAPTVVRAQSTQAPTLNSWTHLVGVYDADAKKIRLYVDGKLQQTTDQPNSWASTGPVNIGRHRSKAAYSASNYWNGDVDDVRIFDQAVTDSEAVLLAGGTPATTVAAADDTAYGRHAILSGNAYVDQGAGWVGNPPGGLVLDGDGDYAATSVPVLHTDQSFTVAGWVQTAGRPTRKAAIFSQEGNVNSGFTLRYAPDPQDPEEAGGYEVDLPDKDAAGAVHQTASHSSFQSDSSWDHVAIVYDAFADEVRLYVNGVPMEVGDNVSHRDNTLAFDALKAFQIGRTKTDGTYGEYWPGVIDDVWAFNGVLDEERIQQLANGTELPTDTS